jgi:hypothetical protein
MSREEFEKQPGGMYAPPSRTSDWTDIFKVAAEKARERPGPFERAERKRTDFQDLLWKTVTKQDYQNFRVGDLADQPQRYADFLGSRHDLLLKVRDDPWPVSYQRTARDAFDAIPRTLFLDLARSKMSDEEMVGAVQAFVASFVKEKVGQEYEKLSSLDRFGLATQGTTREEANAKLPAKLRRYMEAQDPEKPSTVDGVKDSETFALAQAFGFHEAGILETVYNKPAEWLTEFIDSELMQTLVTVSDAGARALDWLAQKATNQEDVTFGQVIFGGVEDVSPEAYNVLSGTTDAAKLFFLDTFVIFGKALKVSKLRRGVVPIQNLTDPAALSRFDRLLVGKKDAFEMVDRGIRSKPVDRFVQWYSTAPAEMRTPGALSRLGEKFGWRIRPEAYRRLQTTTNAEDVRKVLHEEALGLGPSKVQNVETLPLFPWHAPAHQTAEKMLRPGIDTWRMTWGNKFDPVHPAFEKYLRRYGDYMWDVKAGDTVGAKVVDEWVSKILLSEPNKTLQVNELEKFSRAGLEALAYRLGATVEQAEEALAAMAAKYPHTAARVRDPLFGLREVPEGVQALKLPFRNSHLERQVRVHSYMDALVFKRELGEVMGDTSLRFKAAKGIQDIDAFVANHFTKHVVRLWLARPGLGVKIGPEEAINLAGHHEIGRWYRRQMAEQYLDDIAHIPFTGHPFRASRWRKVTDRFADDLTDLEIPRDILVGNVRTEALRSLGANLSDDAFRTLKNLADDIGQVDPHRWTQISFDSPAFIPTWYHYINHQILGDSLSALLVTRWGPDAADAGRAWLRTKAGESYLRQLPKQAGRVIDPPPGVLFHGSPEGLLAQVDPRANTRTWREGGGFYATESLEVAEKYGRGATATGARKGQTGAVNWVRPKPGIRILDLEAPADVALWRRVARRQDWSDADFDQYVLGPSGRNPTNRKLREELLAQLDEPFGAEAVHLIDNALVDEGIHATRHIEGVRTGRPHRVTVFKTEDSFELVSRKEGKRVTRPETDAEKLERILQWHLDDIAYNLPEHLMPFAQAGQVGLDDLNRALRSGQHPQTVIGPTPIKDLTAAERAKMGISATDTVSPFEWLTGKAFGLSGRAADAISRKPGFKAAYRYRANQLEGIRDTARKYGHPGMTDDAIDKLSHEYAWREMYRFDNPVEKARVDYWLRNVIPFTYAQTSFYKRWSRMLATNPGFVSRARHMMGAGEDLGFVERDDNDNLVLQIPISAEFYSRIVNRNREAPPHFARLAFNLGSNISPSGAGLFMTGPFEAWGKIALPPGMPFYAQVDPGFSPMITIPVGAITATKPKYDWARNIFLGGWESWDPDAGFMSNISYSLSASWMRDLGAAVLGPEGDRGFASAVVDVTAWAEFSKGDDPHDPKNQDKYKKITQAYFALRAASKFFGPYSLAKPVFMTEDERLRELIDEHGKEVGTMKFFDEQEGKGWPLVTAMTEAAAQDPRSGTTRPPKFLLAPTKFAEEFHRDNPGFFEKYGEVAGLFTYRGTDKFDPQAYRRQMQRGQRVGRDLRTFWFQMNIEAGMREYYETIQPALEQLREQGYKDAQVAAMGRQAREMLNDLFPGFEEHYDGWSSRQGHRERAIEQLREAVKDPLVAKRKDVKQLASWLDEYAKAEKVAVQGGLASLGSQKATTSIRRHLVGLYYEMQAKNWSTPLEKAYTYLFMRELEDSL